MQLVLTIHWAEEHSGSGDICYTFEYEDVEQAKYDLLTKFLATQEQCEKERQGLLPDTKCPEYFLFAGHTLDYRDLCYNTGAPDYRNEYDDPLIETLESWFKSKLGTDLTVKTPY